MIVVAGAPDRPLKVGEGEIPCYLFEDEARVLSHRGLLSAPGINRHNIIHLEGGTQLPSFAASDLLRRIFMTGEIRVAGTNPIHFSYEGTVAYGYPATVLLDMCKSVLDARRANALRPQQHAMADRCERLLLGFTHVGIVTLVD